MNHVMCSAGYEVARSAAEYRLSSTLSKVMDEKNELVARLQEVEMQQAEAEQQLMLVSLKIDQMAQVLKVAAAAQMEMLRSAEGQHGAASMRPGKAGGCMDDMRESMGLHR
jgi:hypothetical protein